RDLIAEVRRRSPLARIVAVGYGTPIPSVGCEALGTATESDLRYLQDLVDRLSDTLRRVAAEEGVSFVEMRDLAGWQEHSACAAPDAQWIRGLDDHGDGFPLHPSALGMAAMAGHVLETISTPQVQPEATSAPMEPVPAPTTSTRPTPSPQAPAAKPVPTSRQRLDAAARTLRLRAVCTGSRASRRVTLRISGGHGLVRRSTFRLGRSVIDQDSRAPFAVKRSASALKRSKFRGSASARVVLRHGKASRTVTLRAGRPGCLR
ncbi:MAG: GDSL-type esterase/lipase family protein, partial [Aeromicrobium sp.]